MVISIDGMSATGKSTIAFQIAQKLKLKYLNSGSIYRCIALKIINKEIDLQDPNLSNIIENLNIDFIIEQNKQKVYLDNKDVTEQIRYEKISTFTPTIANNPIIKPAIRTIQKRFIQNGNIVIEGRDIATRIAPQADYKFYLSCSLEKRAERLYQEKKDKEKITYQEIYTNLQKRDEKDILDANFIKPTSAIEIDTTNMTLNEVQDTILSYIKEAKWKRK